MQYTSKTLPQNCLRSHNPGFLKNCLAFHAPPPLSPPLNHPVVTCEHTPCLSLLMTSTMIDRTCCTTGYNCSQVLNTVTSILSFHYSGKTADLRHGFRSRFLQFSFVQLEAFSGFKDNLACMNLRVHRDQDVTWECNGQHL